MGRRYNSFFCKLEVLVEFLFYFIFFCLCFDNYYMGKIFSIEFNYKCVFWILYFLGLLFFFFLKKNRISGIRLVNCVIILVIKNV